MLTRVAAAPQVDEDRRNTTHQPGPAATAALTATEPHHDRLQTCTAACAGAGSCTVYPLQQLCRVEVQQTTLRGMRHAKHTGCSQHAKPFGAPIALPATPDCSPETPARGQGLCIASDGAMPGRLHCCVAVVNLTRRAPSLADTVHVRELPIPRKSSSKSTSTHCTSQVGGNAQGLPAAAHGQACHPN